jgi:biotin operon repressor
MTKKDSVTKPEIDQLMKTLKEHGVKIKNLEIKLRNLAESMDAPPGWDPTGASPKD